ncbi:sensor histidine kinase [Dyadobacter fanqingshengii]|uniref:Histidine kinase n=1 Tax=Dyadobacter fanqingshengii TaxID=2906443 RepID=A0A9X1PCW6_9BACT|nr:histidine kinase [Dyadobacter fanqingshengii]MCF0042190.1 histidine kinase [Dyadobacter fanqingshengii]USJ35278.1 histidine kinase [Dyadobacter fanqingshengii]
MALIYRICFAICFLPGLANAQFIFQNLRTRDGLSSKVIQCLYKDNEGFLWIGTARGLNRFDGAIVKQYRSKTDYKDLYINAIQPFGDTEIIIGTREGLRIFDKKAGSFRRDQRFNVLEDQEIINIKSDPYNRLWILTKSEMYVFVNGKLVPADVEIPDAKILHDGNYGLSVMTWDNKRNGFWLGGLKTYFIDCKKNMVYHKLNNPEKIPILQSDNVFSIAVDRNSNIWYGCNVNKSLNFWDCRTNDVKTFFELEGKKTEGINFLFIDKKDRVWISTWSFAAYIKEPGEDIKKIPYSQNRTYSVGYGYFQDIIEDQEGNIWLGTINGISKVQANAPIQAIYQLPSFEFFLQTGFAHSNSIVIENENIMASKEEGMVRYNMKKRTYKRYVVTDGPDWGRNRFLMSVHFNDTWWCAGFDGVYSLKEGENKLKAFTKIRKPNKRHIDFIFLDKTGHIWFQVRDDAIYRYNPKTEKCDRFDKVGGRSGFVNSQSFLVKRNGDILFGVYGLGFLKFDTGTEQFSTIPVNSAGDFLAYSMAEDDFGNTWAVARNRGILKFDTQNELIDSLNSSNDFFYDHLSSIAIDHLGNVWAGGSEGLLFVDPQSKVVTRVEIDLGQNLQDFWNYLYVTNKRVYAVMLDHVLEFDPSKFASLKVKKAPHITSVKVFGNEKEDFQKQGRLELQSDEDYLTFQYASLDHRDVPSLKYSYFLEGFDKNWINAGRSLVASYKNLPWGEYKFKVRSTDEHGNWMKVAGTLLVNIQPPWWQQSWFIASMTALFGFLLINLYRAFIGRKRKLMMEASIDYFANSVYGGNSVNEICWDIARNCITQLDFQDCVVYLMDKKKNVLIQKAAISNKANKGIEVDSLIEIPMGRGIVGTVATTGKQLLIPDTSKDERYVVNEERRFSELSVPIIHDGKVIGVIDSEHTEKNYFKEEHLKALSIIASISSGKIAEALAQAATKEKEIELLEINKMLAESQLMALRAQMNPHFVFNCLNSIQECIVTEKFGEASIYLNLFSKLFRTLLNNSGKNLVTIEEERHVLELYLQLEEMRFSNSFSYEIRVDDELEVEEILVPAMLIQPYVENALWHGLMHSKLERKLLIEFKKIDEDIFECRIDDNGIGRKKSYEIKAFTSKSRHHVSRGLGISSDRLAVLTRQGHHAEVHFVDKMHENGEAAGTLVIVRLSTYLK